MILDKEQRVIFYADGRSQNISRTSWDDLKRLLKIQYFEVVNLRNGYIMLVDEDGIGLGLPFNPAGTKLYHSICYPGVTQGIYGDVAVVPDSDYK